MNIMIGDSITAWNPRKDISNYGVPGDTTRDILWRIEDIQISKNDSIFLMMGINDILMGVSNESILNNYYKIIDVILEKGRDIYIISILPIAGENLRNERVLSLNKEIEKKCIQKGIEFIDVHKEFIDENNWLKSSLTTDGIHLSTKGYEVLNRIIDEKMI